MDEVNALITEIMGKFGELGSLLQKYGSASPGWKNKAMLSARDLEEMGFSRSMAYTFLNRADMPVLKIEDRKFLHKEKFLNWLDKNTECFGR